MTTPNTLMEEERAWRLRFVNFLEQVEAWHKHNNGDFLQARLYLTNLLEATDTMLAIIDRLASATPEGWKLTPREPTQEMTATVCHPMDSRKTACTYWRAMYDAAPAPPKESA